MNTNQSRSLISTASRETKWNDPGAAKPRINDGEGARESGVGAFDSGPGSGSGGDVDTDIVGVGSHPSLGLKRGVVVNIESTVQSIQRAVEEAELMAGCQIYSAFTGIAGSHIRSINSRGMVAIKDREVNQQDVERVIETAKAIPIPTDQQVLHILNQEFIVDGQGDVREPLGMSGVRLEVNVHIVTGAVSAAQNIVKCVRRCGLDVRDLILQAYQEHEEKLAIAD